MAYFKMMEIDAKPQKRASPANPQPDYIKMHEISRHAIHSSETIAMAIQIMRNLIEEHKIFFDENKLLSMTLSQQSRRVFRMQTSMLQSLQLRSKALEERLRNEINLVLSIPSYKLTKLIE
jgi:hypothetical protein